MQHCGVASVIAHKLVELERAGIAAGDKMLNWMALNFGELSTRGCTRALHLPCQQLNKPASHKKAQHS